MTQGERGPRGDHGQTGDVGATGERGKRGPVGAVPRNVTKAFLAVVVVSTLVLSVMGYTIIETRKVVDANTKARGALCAIRLGDQRQLEQTRAFLRRNPNGIPGISRAVLRQSLERIQDELDALSELECPEEVIPSAIQKETT